eukprot:4874088-Amphidinium_carterae.3
MWVIVEGSHCQEERSMPPLRDGRVIPDVKHRDKATPVWAMITSTPEFLGNKKGDSELLNLLGLEIELLPAGGYFIHQMPHTVALLERFSLDLHFRHRQDQVLTRPLERLNIKQLERC